MTRTRIVAERTFTLGKRRIVLRVHAPRLHRELPEWRCKVELDPIWPKPLEVVGEDSLQALLLAIRLVQPTLRALRTRSGQRVAWFGASDLGLPTRFG